MPKPIVFDTAFIRRVFRTKKLVLFEIASYGQQNRLELTSAFCARFRPVGVSHLCLTDQAEEAHAYLLVMPDTYAEQRQEVFALLDQEIFPDLPVIAIDDHLPSVKIWSAPSVILNTRTLLYEWKDESHV